MKFLKTHYGRAINVVPSDTVNIPNPAGIGNPGLVTSGTDSTLHDSSANFTTNLLGAIVMNDLSGARANVIGLVDSTTLKLDSGIFASGDTYYICNSDNNQGCSLYIPAQEPNPLKILTVGGDVITLGTCGDRNSSIILPISVLKVFDGGTSLTDIVALW